MKRMRKKKRRMNKKLPMLIKASQVLNKLIMTVIDNFYFDNKIKDNIRK